MEKIHLTDDTIDTYINNTFNLLPAEIKKKVSDDYNYLIDSKAKEANPTASFIDCIDIYFFGACLLEAISKLDDITDNKELYLGILVEINKYLYKKQYESERKFLKYIPDSKSWINQTLGLTDKRGVLQKDDNNTTKGKFLLSEYVPFKAPEIPNLYIPKLEKEVLTTPSLLKVTGLMNPEIAKLINDGNFTNLTSFKLEDFSLQNQFVIRHRESQYIPFINYETNEYLNTNINFYKINKKDDTPQLNKYYLFRFVIIENIENEAKKTTKLIDVMLLLNAISHVEFQPGYLDSLKKKLTTADIKERYIFTFGILSSFKYEIEFIGQKHRCALIYDTHDKKIYYIDSFMNEKKYLLPFAEAYKTYNSIETALLYKFTNVSVTNGRFDDLKNYSVNVTEMHIQEYDLRFKDYIRQSAYQRRKAGSKQFDWTAGYCGTYILLFLVIMILNPGLDVQTIIHFFIIISDSNQSIATNHEFLRLLIRSFALQLENYIYGKTNQIDIDNLDIKKYIETNGKTIKTTALEYDLKTDAPNYYANPINDPLLKAQMFHETNINKIRTAFAHDKVVGVMRFNIGRLFPIVSDMFRKIKKLQTKLTPEQRQWQFDNYGPDDIIYFVNY